MGSGGARGKRGTATAAAHYYRRWTPAEDAEVRRRTEAGASAAMIGRALGRSTTSVEARRVQLGVRRHRPWSATEIAFVDAHPEMAPAQIARRLRRSAKSVGGRRWYYGIPGPGPRRRPALTRPRQMRGRGGQLALLLAVIRRLTDDSWSVYGLADDLRVSQRTVWRAIAAIRAQCRVEQTRDGRIIYYRLPHRWWTS